MRRLIGFGIALAALVLALLGWCYHNALADPVVRRADVALPSWPAGRAPVHVVLLSDVHIGNATMDLARLQRIVAQVNALKPDLVLIAGDFVAEHDPKVAEAVAPLLTTALAGLHAPLGVVATLGNHDRQRAGVIAAALERAGIVVLQNQAIARGPLAIGGVADAYSHQAAPRRTLALLDRVPGARLILTHSPNVAQRMPPSIPLVLAGHTHCGQIDLPWLGPVRPVAMRRYTCGVIREGARTTIVTAGLGTSSAPFRFRAPPDLWLLTLGPG